jgi:2,4-dienoyl-CoA reductase-like NADH-dependent reductase (Old Yellow Enzyme family)
MDGETMPKYKRIAQLKTSEAFRDYIASLGIDLPFDKKMMTGSDAPLAQTYTLQDGFVIGNRFCTHPMEGWDGTLDGKPSELTTRRWRHFGRSGAKLIWGGEAVAVVHTGRANPNQLLINPENLVALKELRTILVNEHETLYGTSDDLLIGLQLTHSGRFSRPDPAHNLKPVIAYRHPYLDDKFSIPDEYPVITDDEIRELIMLFVDAAEMAQEAGFQFVDIKHCHGYLGHEFLTAYTRPGPYGGSFENRTRFLKEIVSGIQRRVPKMRIGVRLSAFDFPPFQADPENGVGAQVPLKDRQNFWFGSHPKDPTKLDFSETVQFLELLQSLGLELVNLTAGSPYYTPHILRPALFPPSDGYLPPEDPLVGVARQIAATAELKAQFPDLAIVGTAYSYLQEWLPHVAQYVVRKGGADFIGLGRLILSYPEFPADVLAGKTLARKRLCRTFSDCTTAPRNHLVSGCYPLDQYYQEIPDYEVLKEKKQAVR